MKLRFVITLVCISLTTLGCRQQSEETDPSVAETPSEPRIQQESDPIDATKLEELSALLRQYSETGTKDAEPKRKLEESIRVILPGPDAIGEDNEWVVTWHDKFFDAKLRKKENARGDHLFVHILYKMEEPKHYGNEDFAGYRGMGMTDKHYFILVGKLELRAVASSEEYMDDAKIKTLLQAFPLEDIQKL